MIISLFGPDGVGKSTIANALRDTGCLVFSGTHVSQWPDQTWIHELNSRGLHEPSIEDEDHFLEKIRRLHTMIPLYAAGQTVIIDSDPFHKTLMHDYSRALKKDMDPEVFIRERFEELSKLADMKTSYRHVGFQISNSLEDDVQARILQERVNGRGSYDHFDPRTVKQSLHMVKACRLITQLLKEFGQEVIMVETNKPLDTNLLTEITS